MFCNLSRKKLSVLLAILVLAAVVFGIGIGLCLTKGDFKGGIVTNGYECAEIGKDILSKGGSAADAGVAALLCEGIAMPQSTGLGGGFFMTIYTKETGKFETLNAREMAPKAATPDMFKNNNQSSMVGGLSVAVPGELMGYWYVHQKYGKLTWKEIIQPTIDLCKKGHLVTAFLAKLFKSKIKVLQGEESLSEIFIDPKTGEPWVEGDRVKRLQLAKTLEIVAEEGASALYNGSLTKGFVEDIRAINGIITEEDMNGYKPQWLKPIITELQNTHTLATFPPPGSGIIMSFILKLLENNLNTSNVDDPINWQRITEAFKFGYGKRTLLGDPDFVPNIQEVIANFTSEAYINAIRSKIKDTFTSQDPKYYGAVTGNVEDHGTAHISIIAPNGDAVAATGTINLIFGSQRRSRSTGIILNDEMDDFSFNQENYFNLPPSPANFIAGGKRPLSSMCPSIITNKKDGTVRLVVGAAGGSKITTSVSLVTIRQLWMDETLSNAIQAGRIHHQLSPMEISAEEEFNKDSLDYLKKVGHVVHTTNSADGFAAVTGVSHKNNKYESVFDPRRPGSAIVF